MLTKDEKQIMKIKKIEAKRKKAKKFDLDEILGSTKIGEDRIIDNIRSFLGENQLDILENKPELYKKVYEYKKLLKLKKSACDKCKRYKNRVDDVENEHRRNDMFMKMKTYANRL